MTVPVHVFSDRLTLTVYPLFTWLFSLTVHCPFLWFPVTVFTDQLTLTSYPLFPQSGQSDGPHSAVPCDARNHRDPWVWLRGGSGHRQCCDEALCGHSAPWLVCYLCCLMVSWPHLYVGITFCWSKFQARVKCAPFLDALKRWDWGVCGFSWVCSLLFVQAFQQLQVWFWHFSSLGQILKYFPICC